MSVDMNNSMMEETKKTKTLGGHLKSFAPFLVLLAGLTIAFLNGWQEYLSLESFAQNIGWLDAQIAENFTLVFLAYMLIYAGATAFMVPASFLTLAGGVLFGLAFGTGATVIAATAGASILFVAARTSIGETLKSVVGPFIEKMQKGFNEDALSYMFALRLIPAFPFAVVNIAPAILGAKYRDYFIATLFGIIPGTLAYTWIGVAVGDTIRAGGDVDIGTLAKNFIPAFIALGVVALIPVAYKKFIKKDTSATPEA